MVNFRSPVPALKRLSFCLTAVGTLLLLSARAADTIEVSKRAPKMDLPSSPGRSETGNSRPFDFLHSNSSEGGVVEPLPFPSNTPLNASKKLLEMMDQRKNWMFAKPGESKSSLNDMLGVRENEFEADGKKPKKSVEKFLEDNEKKAAEKSSSQSTNSVSDSASSDLDSKSGLREIRPGGVPKDMEKSDKPREFNPVSGRFEAGPPSSLTPAIASLPATVGGFGSRIGDFGASSIVDLRKDQMKRDERWSQLFDRGGVPDRAAQASSLDPVNFKSDSTLQPVNPIFPNVTPSGLAAIPNRPAQPDMSRLGFANPPMVARPSVLEGIEARSMAPSLASPAIILPAAPTLMQPKPAVLEFPRRQF